MFFNPLFLQVTNSGQSTAQLNVQKMNGASYLFSDIIKVCIDKTETLQGGVLPTTINSDQEFSIRDFFENIFKDRISVNELQPILKVSENDNIENLINNSSVKLSKTEVHQIITGLLKAGNDFNGKVSLLLDKSHIPENETSLEYIKESPENLIAVLKSGGTLLIEDPEQSKDNGLLITIVEKEVDDNIHEQSSDFSMKVNESKIDASAEYEFKVSQVNTSDILNTSEIVKDIYSSRKINVLLNNPPQDLYSSTEFYKNDIPLLAHSFEGTYKKVHLSDNVSHSTEKIDVINVYTSETKITYDDKLNIGDKQESLTLNEAKKLGSVDENKPKVLEPEFINISTDKLKYQSILNSPAKTTEINDQIKPEIPKLSDINVSEKDTKKNIPHLNTKLAESIITNKTDNKNIRSFENPSPKDNQEQITSFNIKVEEEMDKLTAEIPESKKLSGNKNIEPLKKVETKETDQYKVVINEVKAQKATPPDEVKVSFINKEKIIDQNEKPKVNNTSGQEIGTDRTLRSDKTKSDKMTMQIEKVNTHEIKVKESVRPVSFKEVISRGIKELNLEKPETEATIKAQVSDNIKTVEPNSDLMDKNNGEQNNGKQNITILRSHVIEQQNDFLPEQKPVITKQNITSPEKVNTVDNQNVEVKSDKSGKEKPAASDKENITLKKNNTDSVFRTEPQVLQKEKSMFQLLHEQSPSKVIKASEVIKEVAKFIQDGTKNSIVMKLDPENLGSVKIQLDVVNKMIHAQIEVDNETTQKLVENNLNQLYNSLNQNGVQINSLNISLSNFDQKNTKNLFTRKRNQETDNEKITEDKTVIPEKNMGYNTYDYLI